jgi:hypothetical protein
MTARDKLIGMKFGRLTVVDGYHDAIKFKMVWICKCECGSEKIIKALGADLKSGKTKSCSCLRIGRLEEGEASFNRIYDIYRRRTLKKGLSFSISKEHFKELTLKECFYCGIEPKQISRRATRGWGDYIYNGIDRIDSSKGYEDGNVVTCCGQCNVAKNNYSKEEFIEWIHRTHYNLLNK